MKIQTNSFGTLDIQADEIITIPAGLLGFPELKRFCIVDPADDVLILWLQSLDRPDLAFPILEPSIFKNDYIVKLSGLELRDLKLEKISGASVFCILTIEADATQMTANLKAPLVINLKEQIARQVVLQENEYQVKHPMFKELKLHLATLKNNLTRLGDDAHSKTASSVKINQISESNFLKPLHDNHH